MNAPSKFPLAYHITFGTYGTRLHGDNRGTVCRKINDFRDDIIGEDRDWEWAEQTMLRFPPRVLTTHQRNLIESSAPAICARGGWELVAIAAAPDHVHTILKANVDGEQIRKWLKRWLSEALTAKWPLEPEQVWWAECGSVKWVWTTDYYEKVVNYVKRQRSSP